MLGFAVPDGRNGGVPALGTAGRGHRPCGGLPAVAVGELVGQRGEGGVDLGRTCCGRLVGEDLCGQGGSAPAQGGGVVVEGLQDAESPARVESLTSGKQFGATDGVLGGSVPHTNIAGWLVGRLGLRTLQQHTDREHLALEDHDVPSSLGRHCAVPLP